MNCVFEARIYWLKKEQGGRGEIPFGDKYAPIIRITKPMVVSDDFWSVFVVNKVLLNANETIANIKYLSDLAPENLEPDVEFMLYEGAKLVAHGTVLGRA